MRKTCALEHFLFSCVDNIGNVANDTRWHWLIFIICSCFFCRFSLVCRADFFLCNEIAVSPFVSCSMFRDYLTCLPYHSVEFSSLCLSVCLSLSVSVCVCACIKMSIYYLFVVINEWLSWFFLRSPLLCEHKTKPATVRKTNSHTQFATRKERHSKKNWLVDLWVENAWTMRVHANSITQNSYFLFLN